MKPRDPKAPALFGVSGVILTLVLMVAILGVSAVALAGNNPDAKVAVHVIPAPLRPGCAKHGLDLENATCADLITTEPGNAVNAFPVFFDLTEYLGCEYGICWPGWYYSAAFTNCSYFVIGGIANPGDGASHTWLNCYTGMCVPSYLDFYLIPGTDTGGMICPCPAPNGKLQVLDCAEGVDDPICIFCAGVYGAGGDDPCANPPACQVRPASLDFGTVTVGTSADLPFFIENIGGGNLEGTVSEACDHYSIYSGEGGYSIAEGESLEVVVRFSPTSSGLKECTISTGTECVDVACSGMGEDPPVCVVDPTALDFGEVQIGQFAGRNFTIRNDGGGTLEGDVTEACDDYSITSNGGPFSLGSGQQITVGVRFTPNSTGVQNCTIETGQEICDDVSCTGEGIEPPNCEVDPTSIDFGTVTVNESKDSTFTITNAGGGTLTGDVSEVCDDYEIISGGGAFALGALESKVVTVRFSPGSSGLKECAIATGTSCDDVDCSGIGEEPPECDVDLTSLNFGTVTVGQTADRVFTIENIGEGTLTGEVTEACDYYEIILGGGAYALGPAESREVTVRFAPVIAGDFDCTVQTGTECENVSCSGAAEAIPVYVDIRPGQCPNKLRIGWPLMIPVAVLGTADFDVTDIDPATVRLTRETVASEVSPLDWGSTDVGTPFLGTLCDCHTLGADGFQDLRFRFAIADVVSMLELAPLAGLEVPLTITGNLVSGEEIEGADCVLVISGLFWEDKYVGDVGFVTHTGFTPAHKKIMFSYYTKKHDHIVLQVFDVQGRPVAVLVDEFKQPGIYEVSWEGWAQNGARVPAGVYFARIQNGSASETRKVTIIR